MGTTHLYVQIADAIRKEILEGSLQPGNKLPSIRALTDEWKCTPGTVQRAYQELAQQGLVVSRPGQGTHVSGSLSPEEETPLRKAALVHQAEAFLLEALTAGYEPEEVEQAVHLALDRWRVLDQKPAATPTQILRFVGSHDLAVVLIAAQFAQIAPDATLKLKFAGSLGGLVALQGGDAEVAGCHLWDEESGLYNLPFVRRLLPGEPTVLLTLAHRRLGLIIPPGNPHDIQDVTDLARDDLRVVNRQRGAGTRVWIDAASRRAGITLHNERDPHFEKATETEVARAIAEGEADVGPGIEAAARSYGLDFVFLTEERYDLVMRSHIWERQSVQALTKWLRTNEVRTIIEELGGYDTRDTGQVVRVEP